MIGDLRRFLQHISRPGDVREVRIPGKPRTASGYFDDQEALAAAVAPYDGRANLYVTVNPVNPALLARANNRIREGVSATTSDADIVGRRFLPVDIDPVRPSGISATDAESEAARDVGREVVRHLLGEGWPKPLIALSGNGWLLLYPISLPNDTASTALVSDVLGHLATRFNTDRVVIDTTMSNASRIVALVGTLKVKGDPTPDRPHRRSGLVWTPEEQEPIPAEQLRALVPATGDRRPPDQRQAGGQKTAGWVRELLDARGIAHREQARSGDTWYRLDRCPYHPDDDIGGDCGVGERPDGMAMGNCFHNRGAGKGWQDFKAALGLGEVTTRNRPGSDGPFAGPQDTAAGGEWEEVPLPKALTDLPPALHENALVGLVGDVAGATVELTGCDRLSAVVQLLALAGAVVPANVRDPFLLQPAREYVLLVGKTGITRKGTTWDAQMRLVGAADPTLHDRVLHWQGGSGEGLLARFSKTTPDGLPADPRGLVYADEFGLILAQARRTGQTMLPVLRSLWNPDGSADISTRAAPIHVSGLHIAAVLHATPEEVRDGFRAGDISSGTVNRFLVARLHPAGARVTTTDYPPPVFDSLTERLAAVVERLDVRSSGPVTWPGSPAARAMWDARKPSLDAEVAGEVGAEVLARGAGHVARLALLHALVEGHESIEESDLLAAFAVWEACRASALLLFGAMTGDREADRIYSVLTTHGGDLTRTELRDLLGRHGRADDIEHGLVILASRGLITRARRKADRTGGRPTERLRVTAPMGGPGDGSDTGDRTPPIIEVPSRRSPRSPGATPHHGSGNVAPEGPQTREDGAPPCPTCGRQKRAVPTIPGRYVCTFPHQAYGAVQA